MIKEISDSEIASAREVLKNFVVQDLKRESALESGLFAVVNQASLWERASAIVHSWRDVSNYQLKSPRSEYASIDFILNEERVNNVSKQNGWRFHHEPRFKGVLSKYGQIDGDWWNSIVNANMQDRDAIVKEVNYLSYKTTSFWHLCLGGINLLPIDIHVRRQLKNLGVNVPNELCVHEKRLKKIETNSEEKPKVLQYVANEPNAKQYKEIESLAQDFFREDSRFYTSGKINMSLIASVLWWRGANRKAAKQHDLFYSGPGDIWKLPYGDLSRFGL